LDENYKDVRLGVVGDFEGAGKFWEIPRRLYIAWRYVMSRQALAQRRCIGGTGSVETKLILS